MNLFETKLAERKESYLCRSLLSASLLCLAAPSLIAQEEEGDEVFELSPFTVDASKDEGWRASSTLVGSRTNQELKNVPLSVDVLTMDFMEDLGIGDLQEAGEFIAGIDVEPTDERNTDNGTSYRGLDLGGRENSSSSRNFFLWYPRSDNYNTERIDFNKGSNSLMFGDASPGGQATVYTKRAQFRNFGSFTAEYGSFDSNRFMLDINRQLSDKLAVRFNTVDRTVKSYLDFADDHLKAFDVAVTFKPTENMIMRFEAEDMTYTRTRASSGVAVNQRASDGLGFSTTSRDYFTSDGDYVDSRERDFYESDGAGGLLEATALSSDDRRRGSTGDDISWVVGATPEIRTYDGDPMATLGTLPRGTNTTGTRDFLSREINNYTVWLEQRLGDFTWELAANRQEQYQNRNDNAFGNTINTDVNGRMYLDSDLDSKYFGNDVNTVRLTGSYPLRIGEGIEQFLVANVSYLDDLAYSFRSRVVNKAQAYDEDTGEYDVLHDLEGSNRIRVRGYFDADTYAEDLGNPDQWDSLHPDNLPNIPGVFEPMWVDYTTANKPFSDKRYNKSASISASGKYFNGRLRTLLGVRKDEFALKRYILPGADISSGSARRAYLVEEYGEQAWWGQDVYLGSPDEAPDSYAYLPEMDQSSTTHSMGAVYALNKNVNVYANQSTSFRWQGTIGFLGDVLGAQNGETMEVGLKGDIMDGLFRFSLAAYEIDRENVVFRLGSSNNADELEMLFNDTTFTIDPDGTIIYNEPDPSAPGFVEIGRGLNNEHRQITASETAKGTELTIQMRRRAGIQARVAISHNKVSSLRDLTAYIEQVELAEARVADRAAFLAEHWINDPAYEEGTLPDAELDMQEYLEYSQSQIELNSGTGLITGSRGRPYSASWIVDYQFPDSFVLLKLRAIVSGSYKDNYLTSTNDSTLWYGGSTHNVNLSLSYKTKIFDNPVDIRLKFANLYDFENSDYREYKGFVDQYTDEPTWQHRNIRPASVNLSVKYRF